MENVDYKATISQQHAEGDKPGRILAWLLKSETPKTTLGVIRNQTGTIVNTQEEINEVFTQYYEHLYAETDGPALLQIEEFVRRSALPKLLPEQMEELEAPIAEGEIHNAIK